VNSDAVLPSYDPPSSDELRTDGIFSSNQTDVFVQMFTKAQRPLYLFILSQTGNTQDSEEILQNANVVIWKKADQFDVGTNFFAWACQIARYEVLQFRQRHRRDKLQFSEEFQEIVARETISRQDDLELQRQALDHCIRKLSARDQALIRERYQPGSSGKDLASELGRPANSVYQSLGRIRRVLMECIQRRIAEK
jgi:RNA polymerase sigma-70 factor (ECF subfamily)